MATLSVQTAADVRANSFSLATASGGGDVVPNDTGGVRVIVQNTDASVKTVTVKSFAPAATAPAGYAKSDLSKSVGAGEVAILGPFDAGPWNNALKQIEITYSAVTNVKVAAVKGV